MRRYHPLTGVELGEMLIAKVSEAIRGHGLFQLNLVYPLLAAEIVLVMNDRTYSLAELIVDADTPPDAVRADNNLPLTETVKLPDGQVVDQPGEKTIAVGDRAPQIGDTVMHEQLEGGTPMEIVGNDGGYYRLKGKGGKSTRVGVESRIGRELQVVR